MCETEWGEWNSLGASENGCGSSERGMSRLKGVEGVGSIRKVLRS